nr:M1 family peptidase [Segetibacter sp.]
MKKLWIVLAFLMLNKLITAQPERWQQRISYDINVTMNVTTNVMNGTEKIVYSNNSPDTLNKIFIHLYWNAFQPNSMMDIASRSTENLVLGTDKDGKPVTDFDKRFRKRINELNTEEQGNCNVLKFKFNGRSQKMKMHETILEVMLDKPVLPKSSVTFNTEFQCQVPKLSRRSGRDSPEGVRYSVGQW